MPNVKFVRPELLAMRSIYELIDDCIKGEKQVKFRKQRYLPIPNGTDVSAENVQRYADYVTRAVFYNVTGRTLEGLVGQVFLRKPDVEVPPALKDVVDDATGLGINLEQLAKMTVEDDISKGRAGLFVDYPTIPEGTTTRAQLEAGGIRPTINKIEPGQIINWRYDSAGGKKRLTLVVFSEKYVTSDDGFAVSLGEQQRVLRLDAAGEYVQEIYRGNVKFQGTTKATDADGKPFTEIPFVFIGAKNNDPDIDPAPMYHLASINIGHYRNSADHEEAIFLIGQPTAYFAGLQEEWVTNVLGTNVQFGSRRILPLPVGASAGILQASPNTMASDEMKHKEAQMVSLGAKLVENRGVARTAFEASTTHTSESSTIASVAVNVSTGFEKAMQWAARFVGASDKIKFKLNTEFDLLSLSPQDRLQLFQEWQGHAITWGEYRTNLRRAGIVSENDDEAWKKVQEEAKIVNSLAPVKQPANVEQPGSKPGGQKPGDGAGTEV